MAFSPLRFRVLALGFVLTAACRHAPIHDPDTLERLRAAPNRFLAGAVTGLERHVVLDRKDFVYAIALSPDGQRAAFTHLGEKGFDLSLWSLAGEKPVLVAKVLLNAQAHDVESVDFSPDGSTVVTAGRDGALRFFDAASGKALGVYSTEEPLVVSRFHPSGEWVLAGSERGLVTLVRASDVSFVSETRLHKDEVRGIAFDAAGNVYTAGWDKALIRSELRASDGLAGSTKLKFEQRGTSALLRGTWAERASLVFALDERMPHIVVTQKVAEAAGVRPDEVRQTVTLQGALGSVAAPVVRNQRLAFKGLQVGPVDLAICDACVPQGAGGVLGKPFTDAHDVTFHPANKEVELTRKAGAAEATSTAETSAGAQRVARPVLHSVQRWDFPQYLNDLTADATGARLAVAFSTVPARRTEEIYRSEKRGETPPEDPGNFAAIIDSGTGNILQRSGGAHRGIVSTAAISPDGATLASGGWDKRVLVYGSASGFSKPVARESFGWSVRKVRFSSDGRWLAVGAWTPQNPLGNQESDPAAVLYSVRYASPEVR